MNNPSREEIKKTISHFCNKNENLLFRIMDSHDAYGLILYNIIKRIESMENSNNNKTHLELQRENHDTFDVPNLTNEEDISYDRRKLRLELAFEELSELATAYGCEETFFNICSKYTNAGKRIDTLELDKVGVLDALCDIEVINNGTILESGVSENYDKAYLQTHNNNMKKAHSLLCEAEKTVEYYLKEKGLTGLTIREKNGKFIVYRSDGKYLKPYNHKANDLSNFIK